MRLTADVIPNVEGIKRLMIHETENGVYLFSFNRVPDGGGMGDEWYETVADAKAAAQEAYQVPSEAWTQIADPCEHCQQDWIQPVRVKGRNLGQPEWGKLERLLNGHWLDFDPEE
jgi:biofilm protein TabA